MDNLLKDLKRIHTLAELKLTKKASLSSNEGKSSLLKSLNAAKRNLLLKLITRLTPKIRLKSIRRDGLLNAMFVIRRQVNLSVILEANLLSKEEKGSHQLIEITKQSTPLIPKERLSKTKTVLLSKDMSVIPRLAEQRKTTRASPSFNVGRNRLHSEVTLTLKLKMVKYMASELPQERLEILKQSILKTVKVI
jgi:hypothetical protein